MKIGEWTAENWAVLQKNYELSIVNCQLFRNFAARMAKRLLSMRNFIVHQNKN